MATGSPLTVRLWTVTGRINTFQLITIFGTGDAKSLSSGISEALVTTALGLVVAIPTLILHGALSRMAKHKLGLLEQISVSFVNGVTALRERAAGHGTAPDHGGALGDQVSHGHRLEAVGLDRQQVLPVPLIRPRSLGNPQHQLLAGAVDIGIEQTDLQAQGLESQRQVDRRGRLADTTLAGCHGDNMFDFVHEFPFAR